MDYKAGLLFNARSSRSGMKSLNSIAGTLCNVFKLFMVICDLQIIWCLRQSSIIQTMSAVVTSIMRCTQVIGGGQFRYVN